MANLPDGGTTLKQNQIPNEPDLKDLIDLLKKDIFLNMNCHSIGSIQAFNSVNQTALVSISYKKTYFRADSITGVVAPVSENYPLLVDAPVVCLGGGLGALTFPITVGDDCLVLFNDRDIDNWFQGSRTSTLATSRLHSFSDAFILVGIRSLNNILTDYNNSEVELRYGSNTLTLGAASCKVDFETGVSLELDSTGKLKITNLTGEFVATLYQLMTDIQNATTNTVFGPQPLIMPTFTTDLAILNSFKS